jgi:hypothetical protein
MGTHARNALIAKVGKPNSLSMCMHTLLDKALLRAFTPWGFSLSMRAPATFRADSFNLTTIYGLTT